MNILKITVGALLAAVLYYLFGWLVYKNLLGSFFNYHTGQAGHDVFRTEQIMIYRYMGYLCQGILISLVIYWSNSRTLVKGLLIGGIVGLLVEMGFDCQTYAITYVISKHGMLANVLSYTFISAVIGGLVAWMSAERESAN